MESGVCSRNEGMAATGLDGTSIQFSCTESTCIVSMYRIDTIPLLHASAATTRGRGDFYLTVWHVVDCFLCVSCQIHAKRNVQIHAPGDVEAPHGPPDAPRLTTHKGHTSAVAVPQVVQVLPHVVQEMPQAVQVRSQVVQVRPQVVQVRPHVVQGRTHVV